MSTRAIVAAVAGWVAVVVVTSALAWVAIDRAGRDVVASSTGGLTQAGGATPGPPSTVGSPVAKAPPAAPRVAPTSARPTTAATSSGHPSAGTGVPRSRPATATPSRGRPGSPTTPASPRSTPRATSPATPGAGPAVDRSVRVTGGQVGVRCVGRTISLRFAQPGDGWQVVVEDTGPLQVRVVFRTAPDTQDQSEVEAECEAGSPVFSTSNGDRAAGEGLSR